MTRPVVARINTAAFRNNYLLAKSQAGAAQAWAILKADAYGHGLLPMAESLRQCADGIALIELEGAVLLREQGFAQPLMVMEGFYQAEELALFAEYRLTAVIHALWQAKALAAARLPGGLPLVVKIDTGMRRLGLNAAELRKALGLVEQARCASSLTLMTHFADADGERGIAEQMAEFERMTAGMRVPRTVANSAALMRFPEQVGGAGNWVRPGIMLYGASPCPQRHTAQSLGLQTVMTLQSEVISVRELAAGDRVGYGGTFVADRPMRIGVVACGYGDGYPRHAGTGTPISVGGQRTRTLGRVSMDKLCVDLTDFPQVGAGDTAILWGGEGAGHVSADEVASAAGTIAYELFCALAGRVPIYYHD
ncbi:MAG: alanine racemase [Rhodocyclaceae bacterium]|nr:alanine racemase [Rhodocyclaceae bacterium]